MPEKLQKYLANCGCGSRRQMEAAIIAGRVQVNGEKAHIGQRIEVGACVKLDGKTVTLSQAAHQHLLYYKPIGQICTATDPEGRETVFDHLPKTPKRWVMIGRLDYNTAGLLLFTTDGDLANDYMHPRQQIEREYHARISGEMTDKQLKKLLQGVTLEDGPARCKSISHLGGKNINHWYQLVITEGRNREVRRLFEACGFLVNRLLRVRFGEVTLPKDLNPGQWCYTNLPPCR